MSNTPFRIGFLPLVDAALPILAREFGYAEAEGIDLTLVRDMSWATVNDRLLYGHSDAAHLLAPLAIATTLGLGRPAMSLSVPFVLGLNGNAITLRCDLAGRIATPGGPGDVTAIGQRLEGVPDGIALAAGKIAVTGPGRTSRAGVWAGGDCAAGGEDLTVTAVAQGRDAAEDILCVFNFSHNPISVRITASTLTPRTAEMRAREIGCR